MIISQKELGIVGVKELFLQDRWDDRGMFAELFKLSEFKSAGIPTDWVQDNVSISQPGVLRGLHIQRNNPQAKLVTCISGGVVDFWVDLRTHSPTFRMCGQKILLPGMALFLPAGIAHGFYAVHESIIQYKCSTEYDPETDGGVRWDDPELEINLGFVDKEQLIISEKDRRLPTVTEWLNGVNLKHG